MQRNGNSRSIPTIPKKRVWKLLGMFLNLDMMQRMKGTRANGKHARSPPSHHRQIVCCYFYANCQRELRALFIDARSCFSSSPEKITLCVGKHLYGSLEEPIASDAMLFVHFHRKEAYC